MKPIWLVLLVPLGLIAVLVVPFAIWMAVTTSITSHRLNEHASQLRSLINTEVHIGESKDQVEDWMKVRFPLEWAAAQNHKNHHPPKNRIRIDGGSVRVIGPSACNAWFYAMEIDFGPDDRVTARKVTRVGDCL